MKNKKHQFILLILPLAAGLFLSPLTAWAEGGEGEYCLREGTKYARRGEYEKALEIFSGIIMEDSFHPDAHLAMGVLLINMKSPQEALPYMERARRLDPENKKTLFVLAKLHEKLDNTSRAIEAWNNFLSLDPEGRYKRIARRHLKRLEEKR